MSARMEKVREALKSYTPEGHAAALAEVEEWENEQDKLKAALQVVVRELPISEAPGGLPAPIRIERALIIARIALGEPV